MILWRRSTSRNSKVLNISIRFWCQLRNVSDLPLLDCAICCVILFSAWISNLLFGCTCIEWLTDYFIRATNCGLFTDSQHSLLQPATVQHLLWVAQKFKMFFQQSCQSWIVINNLVYRVPKWCSEFCCIICWLCNVAMYFEEKPWYCFSRVHFASSHIIK